MKLLSAVLAFIMASTLATLAGSHHAGKDGILGRWNTLEASTTFYSKLEFTRCGRSICGRIVSSYLYNAAGQMIETCSDAMMNIWPKTTNVYLGKWLDSESKVKTSQYYDFSIEILANGHISFLEHQSASYLKRSIHNSTEMSYDGPVACKNPLLIK